MSGINKNLFLGIDIGAGAVKIALLEKEKKGRIRLIYALAQDYEKSSSELNPKNQLLLVSSLLKKFLQKRRELRNAKIGISIAGQSAFVRLVKIPVTSAQKLRQIILYETQQQVPFPINDVVWDFQVYGRDKKQLSILLAAVKKELISSILEITRECQIELEFIDVSNLALYNCLHYFYRDLKEALILDCGAKTTNIIIVNNGKIWTRSLPLGGEDITAAIAKALDVSHEQAEKIKKERGKVLMLYYGQGSVQSEQEHKVAEAITGVLTELTNEIVKTLNFYKSQHQSDMSFHKVLLCGGVSKTENLDKFFENSISVTTEKINFFDTLSFHPDVDMELNAFLGPAIGLALRGYGRSPLNLNLIPPEYLEIRKLRKKTPYIIGIFLIFLLMLVSFLSVMLNKYVLMSNYLTALDKKASLFESNEKVLTSLDQSIVENKKEIKVMSGVLSMKQAVILLLDDIAEALPKTVWIKALKFDLDSNKIILEGNSAKDLNSIGEFKQNLEEKAAIKNVQIETIGKNQDDIIGFSFSVSLNDFEGDI